MIKANVTQVIASQARSYFIIYILMKRKTIQQLILMCDLEWVWVNRNGPITEMVDLNPAQNGGKNFFSCNAATYDSSPK